VKKETHGLQTSLDVRLVDMDNCTLNLKNQKLPPAWIGGRGTQSCTNLSECL
jgi:hypothetical protein